MVVLGLLKVVAIIFSIFFIAALIGFVKNIFNKKAAEIFPRLFCFL